MSNTNVVNFIINYIVKKVIDKVRIINGNAENSGIHVAGSLVVDGTSFFSNVTEDAYSIVADGKAFIEKLLVGEMGAEFSGPVLFSSNITAENLSGINTGDVVIGSGSLDLNSPTQEGLSIEPDSQVLRLCPASEGIGGAVSSISQSFSGNKTFIDGIVSSSLILNGVNVIIPQDFYPLTFSNQTISGEKNFLNKVELQSGASITGLELNQCQLDVPPVQSGEIVLTEGDQVINGDKVFTGQVTFMIPSETHATFDRLTLLGEFDQIISNNLSLNFAEQTFGQPVRCTLPDLSDTDSEFIVSKPLVPQIISGSLFVGNFTCQNFITENRQLLLRSGDCILEFTNDFLTQPITVTIPSLSGSVILSTGQQQVSGVKSFVNGIKLGTLNSLVTCSSSATIDLSTSFIFKSSPSNQNVLGGQITFSNSKIKIDNLETGPDITFVSLSGDTTISTDGSEELVFLSSNQVSPYVDNYFVTTLGINQIIPSSKIFENFSISNSSGAKVKLVYNETSNSPDIIIPISVAGSKFIISNSSSSQSITSQLFLTSVSITSNSFKLGNSTISAGELTTYSIPSTGGVNSSFVLTKGNHQIIETDVTVNELFAEDVTINNNITCNTLNIKSTILDSLATSSFVIYVPNISEASANIIVSKGVPIQNINGSISISASLNALNFASNTVSIGTRQVSFGGTSVILNVPSSFLTGTADFVISSPSIRSSVNRLEVLDSLDSESLRVLGGCVIQGNLQIGSSLNLGNAILSANLVSQQETFTLPSSGGTLLTSSSLSSITFSEINVTEIQLNGATLLSNDSNSIFSLPNITESQTDLVACAGTQTITGLKTFNIPPSLTLGALMNNSARVSVDYFGPTLTTPWEYTIPYVNGSNRFIMKEGQQVINGQVILTNTLSLSNSTDQIVFSSLSNQLTLNSGTSNAQRHYTVPDCGPTANFCMTAGNQVITGLKTFSGQLIFDNLPQADSLDYLMTVSNSGVVGKGIRMDQLIISSLPEPLLPGIAGTVLVGAGGNDNLALVSNNGTINYLSDLNGSRTFGKLYFMAAIDSFNLSLTGNAIPMIWPLVIYNEQSQYDLGTRNYTAKVNGVYHVSVNITVMSQPFIDHSLSIIVNGVDHYAKIPFTDSKTLSLSTIVKMNMGSILYVGYKTNIPVSILEGSSVTIYLIESF